ncbi:MAG: succinylglutamate desuccinylase/aspartoacylase family protein [Verrucomicrobia bacterium]|nr:succinylglutamate desuccinylase/aspartoacylase family protein [Verrucomicrobiota bacterium]MBU4291915.1 succinylglutamate desuccinylase/aspartoacylase family protein [Verrucomicrobiota bacterium]MBU4429871.1 succinylglutamate desuccinylase/aspartoacylase family protein [Verrucomicrobiota bacterium]MBU4497849.1 succinylglutamate desuccinylase/aspartoacylase family protein [Verrucomicrobiota bacterium]MCG2679310.1 succinylglutamate desuccinylase/aspartoacylase family protein [Kiritimatiellia b
MSAPDHCLEVAGIAAEPGTLAYGRVAVPNAFYPDGAAVEIPLILVRGRHEGPTLYLDAATHGSEVAGTEILQRLTREIVDPERLRGSLIAIPIVNVPSFRLCSGFNPHDQFDNNRGYPGNSTGTMNRQICHFVFQIAKRADYAINFHALSHASVAVPFTYFYEVENEHVNQEMRRMAEVFGIAGGRQRAGESEISTSFAATAPCHGLPALLVELQSQYIVGRTEVEIGLRGVLNVMRTFNMVDGRIEEQHGVPMIGKRDLKWVNAECVRGGFLRPLVEVGKEVERGEEIAILVDAVGTKVASVPSPAKGYVMAYSGSFARPIVREASWLAIIFAEAHE